MHVRIAVDDLLNLKNIHEVVVVVVVVVAVVVIVAVVAVAVADHDCFSLKEITSSGFDSSFTLCRSHLLHIK